MRATAGRRSPTRSGRSPASARWTSTWPPVASRCAASASRRPRWRPPSRRPATVWPRERPAPPRRLRGRPRRRLRGGGRRRRGPAVAARARRRARPRGAHDERPRRRGRRDRARRGRGRLRPGAPTRPRSRSAAPRDFGFRVLGPDGRAVTGVDVEHERPMHLIVVRRDLTGYQHLHPTLGARRPLERRPAAAGGGRLPRLRRLQRGRPVADARDRPLGGRALPSGGPAGALRDGSLRRVRRRALGAADRGGPSRGPHVRALARGEAARAASSPTWAPTATWSRCARGISPSPTCTRWSPTAPGTIRFAAELPSAGRYRLFLQFRHDGRVRTVAHTVAVGR